MGLRNLFLTCIAVFALASIVVLAVSAAEGTTDGVHTIYDTLNDDQKTAYDNLDYAVRNHMASVNVDYLTIEEGREVRHAYRYDHPECWWFRDNWLLYVYNDTGMSSEFSNNHLFTYDEIESVNRAINRSIPNIDMSDANSEHKAVMKIHDWICDNVVYTAASDDPKDHVTDIYGVFVDGEALCEGYTMAFTYLCHRYGLDCMGIVGTTANAGPGDTHSWNMVKVDGSWYFVDTTWDDKASSYDHHYLLVGSGTATKYGPFASVDHIAESLYGIVPALERHELETAEVLQTGTLYYNGAVQDILESTVGLVVTGNTAKLPGNYVATMTLEPRFAWEDGSIGKRTLEWTIFNAVLTARYEGETITFGEAPKLPVSVSGFVGGEDASTAKGYSAPVIGTAPSKPGTYSLFPTGGSADYYYFEYVPGILTIEDAPETDDGGGSQGGGVNPDDGNNTSDEDDDSSSGGKKSGVLKWVIPMAVVILIVIAVIRIRR